MRRFFAAGVLGIAGACGLPNSDEFSRGAPADGGLVPESGSAADAAAPIDGGDAAAVDGGPTNIVADPSFERGTCGTGTQTFFQGTGGQTSDAHTGQAACQACRQDETTTSYTWDDNAAVKAPEIGTVYRAHAWVKRGANTFKDQQVYLEIRSTTDHPFTNVEQADSARVTISDTWQLIEASLLITKPATVLDFYVSGDTAATAGDRCIIIDDVALSAEE